MAISPSTVSTDRAERRLLQLVLINLGERLKQRVCVVDQGRDQRVLRAGLVPVNRRLAWLAVVMPGAHRRDLLGGTGYQPPDPPDRRDQLGDGVLGGDRVGQDRE